MLLKPLFLFLTVEQTATRGRAVASSMKGEVVRMWKEEGHYPEQTEGNNEKLQSG
jgi:hypothetical protein